MSQYEIKKVISSEKYSKRLIVTHKEKKIDRSLKIIHLTLFSQSDDNSVTDGRVISDIESELKVCKSKINHPCISRVLDFEISTLANNKN